MIKVRFCDSRDAELIADLSRQTFYDTFASLNTAANMKKFMEEQFSRESLMKELSEPGNIFFLAMDDKRPVGYARLREERDLPELGNRRAIEIARIYAISDAIGKGVGKILMETAIDIASQKKYEVIWLGVWEKNERALSFYHRWGFEKFGSHVFQLGDDPQTDWLLKKDLTIK